MNLQEKIQDINNYYKECGIGFDPEVNQMQKRSIMIATLEWMQSTYKIDKDFIQSYYKGDFDEFFIHPTNKQNKTELIHGS